MACKHVQNEYLKRFCTNWFDILSLSYKYLRFPKGTFDAKNRYFYKNSNEILRVFYEYF